MREGAIQEQLIRARWLVLGLTVLACGGAGIGLARYWGPVGATLVEAAAIAIAVSVATLWLLRSLTMAAIAATVPLVTAVSALAVLTPVAIAAPSLCGVLIPHAIATVLLPVGAVAVVIAYFSDLALCGGTASPDAAAWDAMRKARAPLIAGLVLAATWRGLSLVPSSSGAHSTDVTVIATCVTAVFGLSASLVVLPLALGAIVPSEAHIADSNRLREWRERLVAILEIVAVPRWAASVTGIAIVITVIALFASRPGADFPYAAIRAHGIVLSIVVAAGGIAGALVARDWRGVIVCGVPMALGAIWSAAFMTHATPLDIAGAGILFGSTRADVSVVTAAAGSGFSLLSMARVAAFRQFDDPLAVAMARIWREITPPIIAVVLLFSVIMEPLGVPFAPVACAICGLLLTPALAVLTEVVFPRRKSVEQLYGKKRVEPT